MKIGKVLAVAVPLLVMAGWTLKHVLHTSTGTKVRLAVTGYDPRDLLAGHYLRYAVVYGEQGNCGDRSGPNCVCLDSSSPRVATGIGECGSRTPNCAEFIRGTCERGRFEAGIERFYMPEKYATTVPVIPPKAEIEVSLDSRGNGVVTGFFVDGVPLADYIRAQGEKRP